MNEKADFMEGDEIKLSNLIDVNTLQSIQNAFSSLTGMAALVTDSKGTPVTEGSNFCDFCQKYTRQSHEGQKRCQMCDKMGAESALNEGESVIYPCHAGLLDFSAPIIANGVMVGCFTGGQVLASPPDERYIKRIAGQLGIDPDEYYEAAKKVPILSNEEISRASNFLFTLTNALSDMAYGKYNAYKANDELSKASQLKSNFLANMSHEIRTPMNAVIGMAELALRENIPVEARNYINQIKSSGKALLTLINDILDFSKIESGNLDLIIESYEPVSLFHDVTGIIMTRIQGKDIELILNINPKLPGLLKGDPNRFRQILINLLNNAAKFTHRGRIRLSVDFIPLSTYRVMLKVCVEDTGIGIKKEDMKKLFRSFEQLDSKRNRNVEGTGLGLAICHQLVELMEGKIWVRSEYEKGSAFYFNIIQEIESPEPSIVLKKNDAAIIAVIKNPYLVNQLKKDVTRLNIPTVFIEETASLKKKIPSLRQKASGKRLYLITDEDFFDDIILEVLQANSDINGVLITGLYSELSKDKNTRLQNLLITKKPFSILSLATIINQEQSSQVDVYDPGISDFTFTAPDAKILMVDDNAINLTVAEGLLEPLKMQITGATSGKSALEKLKTEKYDLIFMDHMMPQMDGIECTHAIRSDFPEYADCPIIALTANAVGNVKEMFIREGMNDFVAKPIELHTIVSKVKQWLPKEKIIQADPSSENEKVKDLPFIADLDVDQAVRRLGSLKLFNKILDEFYRSIPSKCASIEKFIKEQDWHSYTIEVHALKSSSRQIGATALAEIAEKLERYGKENDIPFILAKTPEMFEKYRSYIRQLEPWCRKEDETEAKTEVSQEHKAEVLQKIREAAGNLDVDEMEALSSEIPSWQLSEQEQEISAGLIKAIGDMDCEKCSEECDRWLSL